MATMTIFTQMVVLILDTGEETNEDLGWKKDSTQFW